MILTDDSIVEVIQYFVYLVFSLLSNLKTIKNLSSCNERIDNSLEWIGLENVMQSKHLILTWFAWTYKE